MKKGLNKRYVQAQYINRQLKQHADAENRINCTI